METDTVIESDNLCIFRDVLECCIEKDLAGTELSEACKEKVIQSSHKRKDGLHDKLNLFHNTHYHKNCYLTYTSNNHIERCLKRKNQEESGTSSVKRSKRSDLRSFDFKKNCIICGEFCNVIKDKKHPDRWEKNKAFICRTADRRKGVLSFREVLLMVRGIYIEFYQQQ